MLEEKGSTTGTSVCCQSEIKPFFDRKGQLLCRPPFRVWALPTKQHTRQKREHDTLCLKRILTEPDDYKMEY